MSLTSQTINKTFLDKLESNSPELNKEAAEAVNDFTRVKMREDGFMRKILPPTPLSNDEIDRSVDTDKPVKIVDMEPGSPAAVSVPFGTNPVMSYIAGPRYRVAFDRIMTPKFTKDVEELRTYHMDIRQVISDNAIKDMLAEEDGKFLAAVNTILGGSAGATVSSTGAVQWHTTPSQITREGMAESLKILNNTTSHLEPATILCNHITIKDILKWHRDEAGGDISQEMLLKGFTEVKLFGVTFIVTIKTDLVPNSTFYHFAEPKFLGKFYVLEDATMYMDRKAFMLEFFAYSCIGAAIGNAAAVGRYDFNATGSL